MKYLLLDDIIILKIGGCHVVLTGNEEKNYRDYVAQRKYHLSKKLHSMSFEYSLLYACPYRIIHCWFQWSKVIQEEFKWTLIDKFIKKC